MTRGTSPEGVVAFDFQKFRRLIEHRCNLGILDRHRLRPQFKAGGSLSIFQKSRSAISSPALLQLI
jgi:hypothetical protein